MSKRNKKYTIFLLFIIIISIISCATFGTAITNQYTANNTMFGKTTNDGLNTNWMGSWNATKHNTDGGQ